MAAPETKFSNAGRMIVASVAHTGPYQGIGAEMKDLKAWIDSRGIDQAGYPFCLYYDNPTETPAEELRSEACIPVSKAFEQEGKFQMKEIAEVLVAETRHQGPPEQFAMTYGPFLESLLNGGYQILGPAREYYMTVSDATGPGAGFLIQQPVAKK
ncbi:MAG: GyrI-like domain-containing protein [Thaumarchaeota archaeon]|nr:GyrI-like domain-containing protein [Nitrososphaerota archaeon]